MCKFCGFKFPIELLLKKHIERAHKSPIKCKNDANNVVEMSGLNEKNKTAHESRKGEPDGMKISNTSILDTRDKISENCPISNDKTEDSENVEINEKHSKSGLMNHIPTL